MLTEDDNPFPKLLALRAALGATGSLVPQLKPE
jgi:hypothetical protein